MIDMTTFSVLANDFLDGVLRAFFLTCPFLADWHGLGWVWGIG